MSIDDLRNDPASLYTLAVEQATDYAIFLLDAEGRIATWAPQAARLLGWLPSEMVGAPLARLFSAEDVTAGLPRQAVTSAATDGHYRYTTRHRGPDGTTLWVHGRVARLADDRGVVGFVVSLQDVTAVKEEEERHRAEEAVLRHRAAELETLLEVVPMGIGIARDARATHVQVNRAFADLLRMPSQANASLSAPAGERPTHFRVMRDGREVRAEDLPLQVAARTGRPVRDIELDVVFDSGDHVRLLEHASPLFDEHGVSRGSVGAFIDVTERAAAEAHFRRLADSAPVLVWTAGLDRGCTWFNKPRLDFTGRAMQDELGMGWTTGVHPDDLEHCLSAHAADLAAGRQCQTEYRLRRHDGVYRWLLDIGTPAYGARGELTGYIGSCVDITERKEYEQQRERLLAAERHARQEAERVNVIKDEFLAGLSHEMRTPLNAILGWAHLLRLTPAMPDEAHRGLEVIERNARLQTRLIEDLLDLGRIVSGNLRLDVQQVTLATVVEAALESIRPTLEARRLQLVTVLDPEAGPVAGDPVRLQQVLWNLLTNAVKFTGAGGQITVVLERVDSQLELSVSDTGIGIAADFLPYVFDRFRQADGSTTRRYGGLGVGLSIVKQLVELHGGTVRARSPGEQHGATFIVSLPIPARRARAEDMPAAAQVPPVATIETTGVLALPSLAGVAVLVVEEDADARALITTMLRRCGAAVAAVESAAAALVAVQREVPDVLVSDIGLPGQDGYSLVRAIRQLPEPARRLPALALTAYARSEDRRQALMAGFQLHLAKPVDADELCTAVASLAGTLQDRHASPR